MTNNKKKNKNKNVYVLGGVVHWSGPDFNVNEKLIEAYSQKQAFLKLAIELKKFTTPQVKVNDLYRAILKSRLSIRKV